MGLRRRRFAGRNPIVADLWCECRFADLPSRVYDSGLRKRAGVSPSARDTERRNALEQAISSSILGGFRGLRGKTGADDLDARGRLIRRLLDAGADPNARCSTRLTPLMEAVESAVPTVVLEWLAAAGADIEATDAFGSTALAMAIGGAKREKARWLLSAGAKTDGLQRVRDRKIAAALAAEGTPVRPCAPPSTLPAVKRPMSAAGGISATFP